MPRPTRAQGRPRTQVIPTTWGRDHAPVLTRAMRGTCVAVLPGEGPLVFDKTAGVSTRETADPTYDGPCRVQILNAQDQVAVVGEQTQTTIGYLVTLSLTGHGTEDHPDGADHVTTGHVIRITSNPEDPDLTGKVLRIRSLVRGTERFERDLFCVEDQSSPST